MGATAGAATSAASLPHMRTMRPIRERSASSLAASGGSQGAALLADASPRPQRSALGRDVYTEAAVGDAGPHAAPPQILMGDDELSADSSTRHPGALGGRAATLGLWRGSSDSLPPRQGPGPWRRQLPLAQHLLYRGL